MKEIKQLLQEHIFFQDFEPGQIELIAACARNQQIKEGEYLFVQAVDHRFKEFESFKLINQKRIFLLMNCQLDRLLEFIHFT